MRKHLYTDDGRIRSFVNIYVNDEDIRYLEKENTPIKDGDTISIVPSIAGGALRHLSGITRALKEMNLCRSLPARPRSSETGRTLSKEEIQRYSRHLIMPEVGMEGQLKLAKRQGADDRRGRPRRASGPLSGRGWRGTARHRRFRRGRLHQSCSARSPFPPSDVGRPKIQAAKERLAGLNPQIRIDTYETRLTSDNALDLFRDYDIIVDGTDNFPTRYLVNDACVLLGKPNVYGSIFRFEGQATVFNYPGGPCYRCLYPEPPPPGLVPSCAEGGVLGVLAGHRRRAFRPWRRSS